MNNMRPSSTIAELGTSIYLKGKEAPWEHLGMAIQMIGIALGNIYDEVHALRMEIQLENRKIRTRGPIGR
jgi:hypothetical protein